MFRLISSLDWANSGYQAALAASYVEEMAWYEQELAEWLQGAKDMNNDNTKSITIDCL
jgi:hypothetical protein